MANLQDIINLSKADGGKFFVMDESGEVKLVILPVEDYEKLLESKLVKKLKTAVEDIEKINREIIRAQLTEVEAPAAVNDQQVIVNTVSAKTGFTLPVAPAPRIAENIRSVPRQDLREEVIDPSFDFEGPKMEIDDL